MMLTNAVGSVHGRLVMSRRVEVLARSLAEVMPGGASVLDVGAGDGQIAALIGRHRADVSVQGIDIMLRPETAIPVTLFDGRTIPFADDSFDAVTFVDVLHHTDEPSILLREAARVARRAVIIKDHLSENALDWWTLRVMDWVGNAPHGVVLPYNYLSRAEWDARFADAGLRVDEFTTAVPLYPAPLSAVFGRKLHFITRLVPV